MTGFVLNMKGFKIYFLVVGSPRFDVGVLGFPACNREQTVYKDSLVTLIELHYVLSKVHCAVKVQCTISAVNFTACGDVLPLHRRIKGGYMWVVGIGG